MGLCGDSGCSDLNEGVMIERQAGPKNSVIGYRTLARSNPQLDNFEFFTSDKNLLYAG